MNILKREDVRSLPAGTSFYLGYGTSLDDLLAKGSFGLAYTLP